MAIVTNTEILTCLQMAGYTVTSAEQDWLTLWQPLIEGAVKEFLGWNVESATYTEYYVEKGINRFFDGDPLQGGYDLIGGAVTPRQRGNIIRQVLPLRQIPVRSIASVYENPGAYTTAGGSWPSTTLLPTNAYYLDTVDGDYCWTGHVYRINGLWNTQVRTIKVTYSAGMTSNELSAQRPAIKMATLKAIVGQFIGERLKGRALKFGGILNSVGIKDSSQSWDNATLLKILGIGEYKLPKDCCQLLEPYINYNRKL